MIRKIYTLLILGLCLGFAACSDDNDGLDPNEIGRASCRERVSSPV